MAAVIKAEHLSKAYQLGDFGTGTISRDLERFIARLRGKEDPFLKIGETNDRTTKGGSDIVWSLKDLNFGIEQGDAVGVIGRNGAGKSTLLKVLSRVTSPTTGSVKIKGRIASLLEVGTGFHPELTGRENVFLNGAILGMRKAEIKRKFDEIVDFAGVERYIDTPVKRYSSGMYVRLAFGVAAHLEPEILIVDEVLAVGDLEFQKKALGKMQDVSKNEGRTVLFVSHNMQAIRTLTNTSLFLSDGMLKYHGKTDNAIDLYTSSIDSNRFSSDMSAVKGEHVTIHGIKFLDKEGTETSQYSNNNQFNIELDFSTDGQKDVGIDLFLKDGINHEKLAISSLLHFENTFLPQDPGRFRATISLQPLNLADGYYTIDLAISIMKIKWDIYLEDVLKFEVLFCNPKNVTSWSLKQEHKYGKIAWLLSDVPKFTKIS